MLVDPLKVTLLGIISRGADLSLLISAGYNHTNIIMALNSLRDDGMVEEEGMDIRMTFKGRYFYAENASLDIAKNNKGQKFSYHPCRLREPQRDVLYLPPKSSPFFEES